MTTRGLTTPKVVSQPENRESIRRDWFLQHSAWEDVVWIFSPTNAPEENRPARIRWDFSLPSGGCFTDSALLENAKKLVALFRTGSLSSSPPLRASTVRSYFEILRVLVRWMDREHVS
jgi:hypothetical protein